MVQGVILNWSTPKLFMYKIPLHPLSHREMSELLNGILYLDNLGGEGPVNKKQGPTRHRPMAHPVVFRYLSYFTTLAEHAVHCLRRCPAFGRAGTCLFLSVQLDVSHLATGWPHDHGPTNVGAMVKILGVRGILAE